MRTGSFFTLLVNKTGFVFFMSGALLCLVCGWDEFQAGLALCVTGGLLAAISLGILLFSEEKLPDFRFRKVNFSTLYGWMGLFAIASGISSCLIWNQVISGLCCITTGILLMLCQMAIEKRQQKEEQWISESNQ